MIDAATISLRFPPAAIIENVELILRRSDGEPLAALTADVDQVSPGAHLATFIVPAELRGEWYFLDAVFDHAVLDRRVVRTWSTRFMFRCQGQRCGASDELQWGLATGVVRQVVDPAGRALIESELRRLQ